MSEHSSSTETSDSEDEDEIKQLLKKAKCIKTKHIDDRRWSQQNLKN